MNKKIIPFLILTIVTCLSFACSNADRELEKVIENQLSSMSLEQKIGQLIMPAVHVDDLLEEEIIRNIQEHHVGGYHFLIGEKLLVNSKETKDLIVRMQEASNIPLLVAADFEGGAGFYFKDKARLPRAMSIGATYDDKLSYQSGYVAAQEARFLGFHVNFYPDVDVNSNAKNPIINIRSFGSDPTMVSKMARAYVRGFSDGGGIAVAKHFPGHGDTTTDSHLMLPSIAADWKRLYDIELKPFDACIDEGVQGIMSAHITLPTLVDNHLPATMSKEILTDLLRNELNFKGLIFTDALIMGGITENYQQEEACIMSLKAGADVLLYPKDVEKSINAIKKAVKSGEISEKRLNESVRKILKAKKHLKPLDQLKKLNKNENQEIANKVIQRAVTLLKNDDQLLPVKLNQNDKILVLNVLDREDGWREGEPGQSFYEGLKKYYPKAERVYLTDKTTNIELKQIKTKIDESDLILVAGFIQVSAFKGSIDFAEQQISLLNELPDLQKKIVLAMFGNPYVISDFPKIKTVVLAYENYPEAETAVLKSILGEKQFYGKLPVQMTDHLIGTRAKL